MFTGIVEEVGTIANITNDGISSSFKVQGSKVIENTKVGDSISTNGVCLTVTKMENRFFYVDVMAETLRTSALGQLKMGSKVNLERALFLDTRIGGHIVSGHIDGTGTVKSIGVEGNANWITIEAKDELLKYMITKGSIAVDGISLTIARLNKTSFEVSIIPHTSGETALLLKKVGDKVNLECDVIGKYLERLMGYNKKNDITFELLKENGFA